MLKALANHGRFLAFGDRRGHVLKPNHTPNSYIINNHGPVSRAGFGYLFYRKFYQFKGSYSGHDLHGRHGVNSSSLKSRNFYSLSKSSSSKTQNAQLAWRRPNFTCLHRVSTFQPFLPLRRLACAMSLSFNRFHVVPRVLALAAGGAACIQKVEADGEYCNTIEGFSARARDGHIYLSSVLYSVYEGAILLFRAVYLAFLFSPAIVLAPFADRFGIQFRKRWLQLVHSSLEKAGPAFIKWGQWAATRPDLFPKDLCVELAKLHSKAPTHSFAYSRIAIEKAFGRKLSEIFEHFEETPVASGSIAQVHRASLRFQYPGQQLKKTIEVAVKVRHPGVGESIRRDFVIINLVATISSVIPALSWLRLDESVRQFAVFMLSQVDLAREASNLSRFIYNFRSRRWKDVSFPKPLYPLVHPSVLVETFENGESVSHYIDDLQGNAHINKDLAHNGTHAFLKMLLEDNFLHADMHPGNILVRVPQRKLSRKRLFKAKPHIVFLDVGMTAELSNDDRVNLLEFFKAVAVRDGHTAGKCTLRFSKQQNCPNPNAFIEELEKTFNFWGTPEGDFFHPVECMHQLLEQVRRHRVNVDGNVCTVMVTILVLEGWQRKLDPNFDIMHTLKTLLLQHNWSKPADCISA